jgi:agmatinase
MVTVLGIPWDGNSSFMRGPALAPAKILEAFHSDSSNYFTESCLNLKDHPHCINKGDIPFKEGVDPMKVIEQSVTKLLEQTDKLFLLGGDHSITFPIIKGFHTRYQNLTILHIDAHSDLYDNFENNPHSHASPFARIMEQGLAKKLVQVGIRTMNAHQREQANRFDVEVIEMKNWRSDFTLSADGPVYISLDIDAIDPAFAPGVSHYEPGGFTSREVISILQNIKANVVGADLVEFNPTRDPSGITAMLAAKLYKEILDVLLRKS